MVAAVVDITTQLVVNIVVADARVDQPYDNTILVDVADTPCDIGWKYDAASGSFADPASA